MKIEKILITGSSGFVGINLLKSLDKKRFNILSPSSNDLDVSNRDEILNYLRVHKPSTIVHLAYKVPRRKESLHKEFEEFIDNINMFSNVLIGANKYHLRKVIFISSTIMGEKNFNYFKSGNQQQSLLPAINESKFFYKLSKIIEFNLFQKLSILNTNHKIIIVPNIYGPYDKFNGPKSHIVAKLIELIYHAKINDYKKLMIPGTGFETGYFVYISDLIDLLKHEIENTNNNNNNIIYLNTLNQLTIKKLVEIISNKIGYKGMISFIDSPKQSKNNEKTNNFEVISELHSYVDIYAGIHLTCDYYLNEEAVKSNGQK